MSDHSPDPLPSSDRLAAELDLHWLTPRIINEARYDLLRTSEIPRRIFEMSTNHEHYDISLEERLIAEGKQILFNETGLMQREANLIKNRVRGPRLINVLDVGNTNGMNTLPIVLELMEDRDLASYVPVTPNKSMNDHAISKLRAYTSLSGYGKMEHDMILADPEKRDFGLDIKQIQYDQFERTGEETINLFIIGGSTLGNYINPGRVLRNVAASMHPGDYFVLIQGIHRSGAEDMWVADYDRVVEYMLDTKAVCERINPDYELEITWDDSPALHGIKVSFDVGMPSVFAGVDLQENQEITVFRSTRFDRLELELDLEKAGLQLISLSMDKSQDNAIFICQK